MEHSFGANGPRQQAYFRGDSLGSSLGSSAIADTGAGFKMGRTSTLEAERRAAQAAKEANVKPARLYLRSTSRGLRRAVDIYMPLFHQDTSPAGSEEEQEDDAASQPEVPQTPPVSAQEKEISYRRSFPYFHRLGMWKLMDNYLNGSSLRAKNPYTSSSSSTKTNNRHKGKKHLSIPQDHR